jgi:hypothetical protein
MHVLDREDKLTMDRNSTPPLDSLVSFLENSFVCKCCRHRLTRCNEEQSEQPLELEVFGLAFSLTVNCCYGAQEDSVRPKVVEEVLHKNGPVNDKKPIGNRLNAGDFEINKRLHLGLQLSGSGRHDGAILAGMLKLNVNQMR